MISSQARFKIVDQPFMTPAKCFLCGVGHGDETRQFIDVQHDFDFYGTIYFCTVCFTEIANSLHYWSPNQFKKLQADHDSVFELNQELVKENEHLRSGIHYLSNHSCRNSDGSPRNDVESSGGKEVSPTKASDGGKQNGKNAKHDALEGPATVSRLNPDSDPLESLRI